MFKKEINKLGLCLKNKTFIRYPSNKELFMKWFEFEVYPLLSRHQKSNFIQVIFELDEKFKFKNKAEKEMFLQNIKEEYFSGSIKMEYDIDYFNDVEDVSKNAVHVEFKWD